MVRPIKKVALAGVNGNLGPAIFQHLRSRFEITVLSRQDSNHTFPPESKVCRVDYNSPSSLISALRGQDAVVSTLPALALNQQHQLIDAAAAVGVRRFIPSEFGSDTTNPKCASLPVFQGKLSTQQLLKDKVHSSGMSYTGITTGPFLDWGLTKGFMNMVQKRVHLYDGGDRVFSTTSLPTIGRTVCAVLSRPVETENRMIKVHDIATTQNTLFAMARKAVGPDGWTVETSPLATMLQRSWIDFHEGKQELATMLGFIATASWGEGYGGYFEQTDNQLLGIQQMTEQDVQELVNNLWGKQLTSSSLPSHQSF
ncbi:NAD(P)-binding protein [Penicillium pulvis]|uniref:NAD(P)-binding protein n=1 Tax=Penicillium pulvis TaxID=1562058 RepID=UPI002548354D|nr:NAD(P)-binding protein [Penicillium pulvis]KAJ5784448.1 NAD(P)-binding protein [Penicillium pulvis]